MKTLTKILVPVDGSVNAGKAVDQAVLMAEKSNAELDFVYVASNIHKDIPSEPIFEQIFQKLPAGIKAEKHVMSGNIVKAILTAAEQCNSDMIVIGSRGLGLLKGALIGSVSQKVVEESPIPVMVVK